MKNMKEFKPLWKLIKEERVKIIVASVLIFLVQFMDIFTGYLNGAAVESISNLLLKEALIYMVIYFIFCILFGSFLKCLADSMLQKVESKLTRKLGYFTYKKSLDMPAYAYEKTTSGEIINRITNDADTLSFTFGQMLYMVSSVFGSLILIVYIFIKSWIVGLEIVLFLLILFLVLKKYNPILKDVHSMRKKEQDRFASIVTESVRGIREIKTLGIKKSLLNDMKDIIKVIFDKSVDEITIRKKFQLFTRVIKSFLEVGTFITCIILLYYGKIDLTFFIAMTYYIYRYMWLIENINELSQTYQRVIVSIGRVNEILENKLCEDEKFGLVELNDTKGVLEFKNVCFGYPNEDVLLKDFNLVIEPNKKIAIVGKSGQGKSTIFNLLTRVFDPVSGNIYIDGVDLLELTEESLRKEISVIRQEPFIFNRSIKENFLLIDDKLSLKQIREYAKMAYLDDYIMSLPNKYDTVLGEGGVNLSGGQKQRLAIARTLAKKSKVILFDEATSALDNNSQEFVKKSIDDMVKDHTVIIVAHRLSTIMDADIIYVIDGGKLVASGKHDELLKTNEIYKNLYTTESLNS